MASSPRILNRQAPSDGEAVAKSPPVAVHHRSACSDVKALRNPSAAKRQGAKPWLAFRSLDPFRALREPDRRRRDEKRPFHSEQKTGNKPKRLLDRKSPIQVIQTIAPAATTIIRLVGLVHQILLGLELGYHDRRRSRQPRAPPHRITRAM